MSAKIKTKIGILGGTFNPIHLGHTHIAREAAARLSLDRVLFVPSGNPPHKSADLAGAEHRLEMVRRAIENEESFVASDTEIRRPGNSYTIDTIYEIGGLYGPGGDFYFLIGADSIGELPAWRSAAELLRRCTFVALTRPGFTLEVPPEAEDKLGPDNAQRLRENALDVKGLDIASTDVRRRLAAGTPVDDLVHPSVLAYIRTHHLYGA